MKIRFLVLISLTLLVITSAVAMSPAPRVPGINDLQVRTNAELTILDKDIEQTAGKLGTLDLTGPAAGALLQNIYNNHNFVVDVVIIDLNGNIIAVAPDKYKSALGQNIAAQPHIAKLISTGQPVLSSLLKTVEGFYAVSLARPIFSAPRQPVGYLSIVFRPDTMIGNIVKPYLETTPSVEVLAIQKDGLIIYDKDIMQIGKLTFSDPLYQDYAQLLKTAKQITIQDEGLGTYDFPSGLGRAPTTKATEWITVGLHGTEWRLIVSKTAN